MNLLMSKETKHVFKALFKVKKKIQGVVKDQKNPFFKSNYADLNQHLETVEPIFEEYGLMLLQPPTVNESGNHVTTLVIHVETGEYIGGSLTIPKLTDPQKILAAVTYFRRGCINSILSLKSLDDDGNTASGKKSKSFKKKITTYNDDF